MAGIVKIYQSNQIGGCITLISTGRTTILIDFGENLPGSRNIPKIQFDWEKEKVNAVFFTHYHGDHIGRFMEIPDDVMLYMGEVTYKVMLNIHIALHHSEIVSKLKTRLKKGTIRFIDRAIPYCINNDIIVTGYDIDHSAFDAFMFLVEADGTNILHTGDFRDHGHRGHVQKNGIDHNIILDIIKYYILKNDRKIDILITEGTVMGDRSNEERFSEKDLLKWATDYLKTNKYVFLKVSSTNVDTLASFYKASEINRIPMYANRYVLNQFKVYREAGEKHNTAFYDFKNTRLLPFLSDKPDADNSKAYSTLEKMKKTGFIAIVSEYGHYEKIMDEFSGVNPQMIYSMWRGYIDSKSAAYDQELAEFCKKYHAFIKHTSGHAYPELIEKVITTVNPTQTIWPIHTENAQGFLNLNIPEELKRKVKL